MCKCSGITEQDVKEIKEVAMASANALYNGGDISEYCTEKGKFALEQACEALKPMGVSNMKDLIDALISEICPVFLYNILLTIFFVFKSTLFN